jgi:drug/metabolite transporter (DMT)-like permease
MGALAVASLFYGYNWVVMKTALRYVDASVFAAMRVFFGAVLLFILLAVLRRSLRPANPALTLVIGLFGMTGSIGLSIWALDSGGAGKTSVLVYTMPMWLLLMSWVILGERVRGLQWLSVALALAGLVFVLSPWSAGGTPLSNILGLAAGICSAASSVAAKILCRDRQVDLLGLNAWQMLFGSIPLVVIALLTAESGPVWTGPFVAALLYNVVLVCGVALLLWFYTLRHLPAGTAGLGRLVAPVVGVVASWIQLGERPDRYELVGMVLIIAGLASLAIWQIGRERKSLRSESPPPIVLAEEPPGE